MSHKRVVSVEFSDVHFGYEDGLIFAGASFSVTTDHRPHGQIVGVMGPSGVGKTTLLRLIAGLEAPSRGSVRTSPAGAHTSYLAQDPVMFEHLSLEDNLSLLKEIRAQRTHFSSEAFERVVKMLHIDRTRKNVTDLSGGEKQRVATARALSVQPDLLLLDEPCAGLDWGMRLRFMGDLRRITAEQSLLVFYVSHDPNEIRTVSDQVLYLHRRAKQEPVQVFPGSFQSLTEDPPNLDIARALDRRLVNTLKCQLTDHTLATTGPVIQLAKIGTSEVSRIRSVLDSKPGILTFSAQSISKPVTGNGLSVTCVIKADNYDFVWTGISEVPLLVQDENVDVHDSITPCGEALLFGHRGFVRLNL